MKKKFKVLSLDGGGVRGLLTCHLLELISKEIPFLEKVDLFAGTSTGSLIALALAAGQSPSQLIALYEQLGSMIFTKNPKMDPFSAPKYISDHLKGALEQFVFPQKPQLADFSKKIVIPAFDLENASGWSPLFFHNLSEEGKFKNAIDATLASCAAPFYFPSYNGKIDGGVCVNHPGLVAACLSMQYLGVEKNDISILSLGTGKLPDKIESKADYGIEQWLEPNVESTVKSPYPYFTLSTQSSVDMVDFYLTHLFKSDYMRVNPPLDVAVALDDIKKLEYLKEQAHLFPSKHPVAWRALIEWLKQTYLV